MDDIKQGVKESVKVFTRTFVSYVAKESTKKMVKSLTPVQRKMLDTRVRNMSDDQLEEYFDKDLYFRSELNNTVKTVNDVQKAKAGLLLENLQTVCEASCIPNLIKALIQPVTRMTLIAGAGIALLILISISMLIIGGSDDADSQFPVANFSSNATGLSVKFTDQSKNATRWNWDFGDGATSTLQNPVHTYSAAGNYTIRLTVSNEEGTDSKTDTINVFQRLFYAYVTNSGDNTVSLIDAATNTVTDTIRTGNSPYEISFSPEGKKVYVANWESGTVSVIDSSTKNVIDTVDLGGSPGGVAVNPAGTEVYVTNVANNTVSVIDTATNNVKGTLKVGNYPAGIAVSPDGTKIYVTNTGNIEVPGNSVSVINTLDNSMETVTVGRGPSGVAVTPDGKKVYVSNSDDGTVSVIDTATNTPTATVDVGNSSWGVAVNPSGTEVYVANLGDTELNLDGYVSVINTSIDRVVATVPAGKKPYKVTVHPEGTKVYVTNQGSNTVSIIDAATKEFLDTVTAGSRPWGVAVVSR